MMGRVFTYIRIVNQVESNCRTLRSCVHLIGNLELRVALEHSGNIQLSIDLTRSPSSLIDGCVHDRMASRCRTHLNGYNSCAQM